MKFPNDAPCTDVDPWLFDQTEINMAMPALQICKRCIFWQKCEDLVEPKRNFYDGICAGKVWRNGRILVKLSATSPNLITVGVKADEETVDFSSGSELLRN